MHDHGIELSLVRESDVAGEQELLSDFGIYGERAVGVRDLDERARTFRYLLELAAQHLRLAFD